MTGPYPTPTRRAAANNGWQGCIWTNYAFPLSQHPEAMRDVTARVDRALTTTVADEHFSIGQQIQTAIAEAKGIDVSGRQTPGGGYVGYSAYTAEHTGGGWYTDSVTRYFGSPSVATELYASMLIKPVLFALRRDADGREWAVDVRSDRDKDGRHEIVVWHHPTELHARNPTPETIIWRDTIDRPTAPPP